MRSDSATPSGEDVARELKAKVRWLPDRVGPLDRLRYRVWRAGLSGHRPIRLTLDGGERLTLRPLPAHDLYTAAEVFCLRAYTPPDGWDPISVDTVEDLGANIGLMTVFLGRRYSRASIRAFEPNPSLIMPLRRHVVDNGLLGRAEVNPVAVGAAASPMWLTDWGEKSTLVTEPGPGRHRVEVIDWLADSAGRRIDVVKMDIEGSEAAILSDPRFAGLDIGALVVEWHSGADGHPGCEAVRVWLESAGYRVRTGPTDLWPRPDCGLLWADRNG